MKTLAKSALGVAVAAAVAATSVQASEAVTMDPSLTFTYKNFYWKEDNKTSQSLRDNGTPNDTSDDLGYDRKEWVHALVADFDTGYVNDLVGAVITAGYAGPLSVKEDSQHKTNVPAGTDGKGDSISGFQQAYLKARTTFSGVEFAGSLGVKKRSTETYADSGSRILDASSYGYDLSAEFEGANLYFTEITGFSDRNQQSFKGELTKNEGAETVDNIRILGANYSYEGLGLVAEYGNSKDAIKQTFLKAAYGFELDDMSSVDLDVRYGKVKSDEPGNDEKAKYYNLNATYNYGNAYVGLGYNKTKDGDYDPNYVDGNNDTFNSSLDLWEKYAKEGEKAYVVSGGYNFADQGLEGLSWDVWYAKGDDADNVENFKRREYGSYVSYAFDGQLEGLSVAWLYTNYRASGNDVGAATVPTDLYDEDVNRLYLTYSVAAF